MTLPDIVASSTGHLSHHNDLHDFFNARATGGLRYALDEDSTLTDGDDGTTAINTAISGLPSTGGIVWLPPFNLVISSTIEIPSGVELRGWGSFASTLTVASADTISEGFAWIQSENFDLDTETDNVALRGFKVDGQRDTSTTGPLVGLNGAAPIIDDLFLLDGSEEGLICTYPSGTTYAADGSTLEGFVSRIRVVDCGSAGNPQIVFDGPHDMPIRGVFVIGQNKTDMTIQCGILFTGTGYWSGGSSGGGSSQMIDFHVWGGDHCVGIDIQGGGIKLSHGQVEGAKRQIRMSAAAQLANLDIYGQNNEQIGISCAGFNNAMIGVSRIRDCDWGAIEFNGVGTTQTMTRTSTGGTAVLAYKGARTSAITFNTSTTAATIETALEGLSTITSCSVSGSAGGPWTVTSIVDPTNDGEIYMIDVDPSNLTGGTLTIEGTNGDFTHNTWGPINILTTSGDTLYRGSLNNNSGHHLIVSTSGTESLVFKLTGASDEFGSSVTTDTLAALRTALDNQGVISNDV